MKSLESRIEALKAKRNYIKQEIQQKEEEKTKHEEEKECAEEARIILQSAAKTTQQNIEIHFSDLVSKAFEIVFDDPYVFKPEFVEKRNKTECELWFQKGDTKLRPSFSSGGGVKNIASFALRLAYWKLENCSPVIILDEPFKDISASLLPRASEVLRYVSEGFGIQLIIVTHIKEIASKADKTFQVEGGMVSS